MQAEPNQELCKVAQLSPLSPEQVIAVVEDRTNMDATELAVFTRGLITYHGNGLYKVSRSLLKEVQRRFKILPRKMRPDGTYPEVDGARSFNKWLEVHKIPKRTAYYILAGGEKPPKEPSLRSKNRLLPPYIAKVECGVTVDKARSAVQKYIRKGNEYLATKWMRQLYFADRNCWKALDIFPVEDIGLADLTVKTHVLELQQLAEGCKNDGRNSDLLHILKATMICARSKKSRAVDNACIFYNENPTYAMPTEAEIADALKDDSPMPPIPDDFIDMHTTEGRKKGRKGEAGLEHFLANGAKLENESDVAPWQSLVIDVVPLEPPTVPTVTATFFVIRRKSDGKFYTHGDRYVDQVELAASKHAAKEWSATLTDLDNVCHGGHEIVEVEATYNLTAVTPSEPPPTPEGPKPTKKTKKAKLSMSPAGQVHIDELPPEVREKIMARIEADHAAEQARLRAEYEAAPLPEMVQ